MIMILIYKVITGAKMHGKMGSNLILFNSTHLFMLLLLVNTPLDEHCKSATGLPTHPITSMVLTLKLQKEKV